MHEKFLKPYNPQETEGRIYELWEKSGYFNPDTLPGDRTEPFTIIMPPPNANGVLHAGHALFITLQDIMTRYARMAGKRALWVPGTDHAGFETQVVYEKKLEKEGRSRFGMDSADLYKEIYEFTMESKQVMEKQIRSMGASCDWSRNHFTLEPDIVERVQETFIRMHKDGFVYRGNRIVNWCPKHQTSLSDVETKSVEEQGSFYYLTYGPFTIGTARPETKFGDKYVVMHPDDARYKGYAHGQTINLEWINGPITATIIKDEAVDPAFGTGVMTITPWHDATDFDIAARHGLEREQVIDLRGKLLPIAGEFEGMKILEAREKIIEKLATKGLVERIDTEYVHVVKRCYKCEQLIEPQIRDQWFVNMKPLAAMALKAVDEGRIEFIPKNYEKIFRYWMENTLDWNISRQIVWGIPIPAWFKHRGTDHEEVRVSLQTPEGEGWEKDTDTFDTWFSSGQWPLLSLGYPTGEDFKTFHPTSIMETGHDLIFKWIPRMVIFSLYLRGEVPFKTVYLHGLVNDAQGKKMSKSKGNVTNPLQLTEVYGTDALRIGLIVGNPPGADLALREEKIRGYKNFANKLWNIARFVLEHQEAQETTGGSTTDTTPLLTPEDEEDVRELHELVASVTQHLDTHRIDLAADALYHYIWHTFADVIVEKSKTALKEGDLEARTRTAWKLRYILETVITLLHPFMPFVTEEIWQNMERRDSDLLIVRPWPTP